MNKEERAAETVSSPANDNGRPAGETAIGLDPRIRTIARAIGRQIAREHHAAWERRRRRAANDNESTTSEPEEEGPNLEDKTWFK